AQADAQRVWRRRVGLPRLAARRLTHWCTAHRAMLMGRSDTLCQEARTHGQGVAADTCPRTLAVAAPTAPETGRTATRGPCSTWMVMHPAGIRKATEPSTHMIEPAAAWSSSAIIAVSCGAVAYVG